MTISLSMRGFSRLPYHPNQLMDTHSHWKIAWKLTSITWLKLNDTCNDATPLAQSDQWIHSLCPRGPPHMSKQWRLRPRPPCPALKQIHPGLKKQTPGHRSPSLLNLSRHLGHLVDVVVLFDSGSFPIRVTIQTPEIPIWRKIPIPPVQIRKPVETRNNERVHTRKKS